MGQLIIDLIGDIVQISGNSTIDTIIFAIINLIALTIALDLVGLIFDAIGMYDSRIMSDVHWSIRVLVFAGLTWLGVKIAQFIRWLCGFQWWVYVIAFVIIIGILVFIYWIKHQSNKKKYAQNNALQQSVDKTEESVVEPQQSANKTKVSDSRCYCPRCGAKLVKRHGPYGDFYGCESYGKTGCRYTRKFL